MLLYIVSVAVQKLSLLKRGWHEVPDLMCSLGIGVVGKEEMFSNCVHFCYAHVMIYYIENFKYLFMNVKQSCLCYNDQAVLCSDCNLMLYPAYVAETVYGLLTILFPCGCLSCQLVRLCPADPTEQRVRKC